MDLYEFESSVISYGSQAAVAKTSAKCPFESSVISYGSQALSKSISCAILFESSVISYGSQALDNIDLRNNSLRVVLSHMVVKQKQ